MKMTGKARSLESGGTEVTSVSEVNVIGILAQMGSRVIQEVSNIIFRPVHQEFSGAAERLPATAPATEAKPLSAASVALAAAKGASFTATPK